jgi:hypothetical protein
MCVAVACYAHTMDWASRIAPMFASFFHSLTTRVRTRRANRQLGAVLAFVAGAVNAGGFLAVQRYTSHMTGIVSGIADDLVLGQAALSMAGVTRGAFAVPKSR